MGADLFANTFVLTIHLALPSLLACLFAGIFAAFLQGATQVTDSSIGFLSRLVGLALVLYLTSSFLVSRISGFAAGVWANENIYL